MPPTISTPRFHLRPLVLEDAELLFALYGDAAVVRHLPHLARKSIPELPVMRAKVARELDESARGEAERWAIVAPPDPAPIGFAMLFHIDRARSEAEIGYALASAQWGKGAMRELLPALLERAFTGIGVATVVGYVAAENGGSRRVLERCGFQEDGPAPPLPGATEGPLALRYVLAAEAWRAQGSTARPG